jgi:hypothetical protein
MVEKALQLLAYHLSNGQIRSHMGTKSIHGAQCARLVSKHHHSLTTEVIALHTLFFEGLGLPDQVPALCYSTPIVEHREFQQRLGTGIGMTIQLVSPNFSTPDKKSGFSGDVNNADIFVFPKEGPEPLSIKHRDKFGITRTCAD